MFTGIVAGVGLVAENRPGRLAVEHGTTARGTAIGASVAVNGVCLTVISVEGTVFSADVVPETLNRSNLGGLKAGDPVNLERPLTPEGLLDGHLVQGHIDAAATIKTVTARELGKEITIQLPANLARYVAEKGSIAVDGVSLTVIAVDDRQGTFTIAFIPHTLERTLAGGYREGHLVNLEVDVVARYVERLVRQGTEDTLPGIK